MAQKPVAGQTDRLPALCDGADNVGGKEGQIDAAEAALKDNDLPATLAELATLPDAAAGVFADWIAAAQTRQDALGGLDDLAAQIDAM